MANPVGGGGGEGNVKYFLCISCFRRVLREANYEFYLNQDFTKMKIVRSNELSFKGLQEILALMLHWHGCWRVVQ